jgi:hypothetical protein
LMGAEHYLDELMVRKDVMARKWVHDITLVGSKEGTETVCVECLIGKQKKPILFKVTEPSSIPYRAPPLPFSTKYPHTRLVLFLKSLPIADP